MTSLKTPICKQQRRTFPKNSTKLNNLKSNPKFIPKNPFNIIIN